MSPERYWKVMVVVLSLMAVGIAVQVVLQVGIQAGWWRDA